MVLCRTQARAKFKHGIPAKPETALTYSKRIWCAASFKLAINFPRACLSTRDPRQTVAQDRRSYNYQPRTIDGL